MISDFRPPDLGGVDFCCFKPPGLACFCSPRKLTDSRRTDALIRLWVCLLRAWDTTPCGRELTLQCSLSPLEHHCSESAFLPTPHETAAGPAPSARTALCPADPLCFLHGQRRRPTYAGSVPLTCSVLLPLRGAGSSLLSATSSAPGTEPGPSCLLGGRLPNEDRHSSLFPVEQRIRRLGVCVCVCFHVACTNDSLMPASEKPWLSVRVSVVARHTAAHKARFQRGL